MGRMGEHINGLHGSHLVLGVEVLQVAGLRGGVAADIDDALRGGPEDSLHHVGVHTGTWGVGDDYVGTTVRLDEVIG